MFFPDSVSPRRKASGSPACMVPTSLLLSISAAIVQYGFWALRPTVRGCRPHLRRRTSLSMKPVIGVTPDFNAGDRKDMGGHEPTYFLRARYVRAVEELGGIPLILPLVAEPSARRRLLDRVDGLLMTGSGPDLPPSLYGERQRYKFPLVSERRADFELELVLQARKRDLPLLGICGGMQTVNVACGGSLYQDIPAQVPGALDHRQLAKAIHV